MQVKMYTIAVAGITDKRTSPGVHKKIEGTAEALEKLEHKVTLILSGRDVLGLVRYLLALINFEGDILWIRHTELAAPIMFCVYIIQRLKGTYIIVDVPTPRSITLKEIFATDGWCLVKCLKYIFSIIMGPWVLWPSHRILQYSEESDWYSYLLKSKTLAVGNGINVSRYSISSEVYERNSVLRLVFVGQIAPWHGVDRMIRAVADPRIISFAELNVIGEGKELPKLRDLATQLNAKNVKFHGFLDGTELDAILSKCHVGVGGLGYFRKHMNYASDLKTREYIARGMYVIGAGNDHDFDKSNTYRYQISNTENYEDLINVLIKIRTGMIQLPKKSAVRNFAIENLSLQSKVRRVLVNLEL